MTSKAAHHEQPTLLGHPTGLYTLFFAEMWERFSYYGMRALLVLYLTKGFLGMKDGAAFGIYGAYTALVYATPFIGGMLADRLLGQRRAVVLGGALMAAGHLLMTIEAKWALFVALGLLIVGNGFFKPNISTVVGSLYEKNVGKKDAGFTIFYIGINLGAAMSGIVCGYVGETFGWHYGFGLATIGMIIGLAVFQSAREAGMTLLGSGGLAILIALLAPADEQQATVYLAAGGGMAALGAAIIALSVVAPKDLSRRLVPAFLIFSGAIGTALALPFLTTNDTQLVLNVFLAAALAISGTVATIAIWRGGLPEHAGAAPSEERLQAPLFAGLSHRTVTYLGILASVPLFALMVYRDQIAGSVLLIIGVAAAGFFIYQLAIASRAESQRMGVIGILLFFSLVFWAFFEQAGSSINLFTDRNVDRVSEERLLTEQDVGKTMALPLTQELVGHSTNLSVLGYPAEPVRPLHLNELEELRRETKQIPWLASADDVGLRMNAEESIGPNEVGKVVTVEVSDQLEGRQNGGRTFSKAVISAIAQRQENIDWAVQPSNVGMAIGGAEVPTSVFQSINPVYILLFGLVFTAIWSLMASAGIEPSTPTKFALGLLQLGLGFIALWYGVKTADSRGMVGIHWLLIGYLLHTTGELCISPVGLSMVTKLSPARLVSTLMGVWFLGMSAANFVASIIAKFTGVSHGGGEPVLHIPIPLETVGTYGEVFRVVGISALVATGLCFALVPFLNRWMNSEDIDEPGSPFTEEEPAATESGAIPRTASST